MIRFIVGCLFLAGVLWAQNNSGVRLSSEDLPTPYASRSMERLADDPVKLKERADGIKHKKQQQEVGDYNAGLAKRFIDLNDALRDFQKAYIGTKRRRLASKRSRADEEGVAQPKEI